MIMPRVPPAAMAPAAVERAYPRSSISGSAIRAMVAVVATEDPDIAPNPAQAPIVA